MSIRFAADKLKSWPEVRIADEVTAAYGTAIVDQTGFSELLGEVGHPSPEQAKFLYGAPSKREAAFGEVRPLFGRTPTAVIYPSNVPYKLGPWGRQLSIEEALASATLHEAQHLADRANKPGLYAACTSAGIGIRLSPLAVATATYGISQKTGESVYGSLGGVLTYGFGSYLLSILANNTIYKSQNNPLEQPARDVQYNHELVKKYAGIISFCFDQYTD